MFNDTMLSGSFSSNQASFLLSKLIPGHPLPNTIYTVNMKAVNVAGAGPLTDDVILPSSSDGMYVFI